MVTLTESSAFAVPIVVAMQLFLAFAWLLRVLRKNWTKLLLNTRQCVLLTLDEFNYCQLH